MGIEDYIKDTDFFKEAIEEAGFSIPNDIDSDDLIEAFAYYVEGDIYEWMMANFRSFFNHGNPNWDWVREYIEDMKNDEIL